MMLTLIHTASYGALACLLLAHVRAIPIDTAARDAPLVLTVRAPGADDWLNTLSADTRHRLDVARQHLDDESAPSQAFRNDTIMRVNIEREALDLSLIDLLQAFGSRLPTARIGVTAVAVHKRSTAEDLREEFYNRAGVMTFFKEADPSTVGKRSTAEDLREDVYTRAETMTYLDAVDPSTVGKRSTEEDLREDVYTRAETMTYLDAVDPSNVGKRSTEEDLREEVYTRAGSMAYFKAVDPAEKRSNDADAAATYSSLLNQENLALGAVERINIAHRILGKPEITLDQAKETGSHGDAFIAEYWNASMNHGGFWATDQPAGKPNFIEGGQVNKFGYTQSTFHKLHCLANLRTILAWHITGHADKMTRDMDVHTIHCLEYIRSRELANPDVNKEPIDTVNYKGMGIH